METVSEDQISEPTTAQYRTVPWRPHNVTFGLSDLAAPGKTSLSECGTWSHAVISSLGARARGGVVRLRCFRVARCQTWTILDSGQSPVMSHRDGF